MMIFLEAFAAAVLMVTGCVLVLSIIEGFLRPSKRPDPPPRIVFLPRRGTPHIHRCHDDEELYETASAVSRKARERAETERN